MRKGREGGKGEEKRGNKKRGRKKGRKRGQNMEGEKGWLGGRKKTKIKPMPLSVRNLDLSATIAHLQTKRLFNITQCIVCSQFCRDEYNRFLVSKVVVNK